MREVDEELSAEEIIRAEAFFQRIGARDRKNVQRLIDIVNVQAKEYFSSSELEAVHHYFRTGEAFFAVYGIGGNVTKEGERPDVDVMIVSNMRYKNGFFQRDDTEFDKPSWERDVDPLWRRIYQELREEMEIQRVGEIPDNYNLGVTGGKCIITLTPRSGARKIDLVYVRSMVAHGNPDLPSPGESEKWPIVDDSRMHFDSETDFWTKDVGSDGQPLPKVLLYRASTTDIERPRFRL